jgi:hypothetical protein
MSSGRNYDDKRREDDDYESSRRDEDRADDNYENDEDEISEYPITNLIKYFNNNNIGINGIFSYEGRVIVILIHFLNTGSDLLIYIPSKYYIKIDSSVKNYLHISLKREEEPAVDRSLFVNTRYLNVRKTIETSFDRIKPLLQDSVYKFAYANKELLVYIDRYNEGIEVFSFNTPFNRTGFYFIVDLENFYNLGKNIEKEIQNAEMLLNSKMYKVYDNEIQDVTKTLTEVFNDVKSFSGKGENELYITRMKKLNEIIGKNKNYGKSVTDCLDVVNKVRKDNFSKLMYIEKVIHFLNEIKELKDN